MFPSLIPWVPACSSCINISFSSIDEEDDEEDDEEEEEDSGKGPLNDNISSEYIVSLNVNSTLPPPSPATSPLSPLSLVKFHAVKCSNCTWLLIKTSVGMEKKKKRQPQSRTCKKKKKIFWLGFLRRRLKWIERLLTFLTYQVH